MSREDMPLLAILTGGSVVVPLTLGLALGWPTWLWSSLIVVLLTVTAMVGRYRYEQGRREEWYDHQWDGRPEGASYAEYPVENLLLNSVEPNYKFLFSGTVRWSSIQTAAGMRPAYQKDIAVNVITECAHDITATRQPDDYVGVQHELAVTLGAPIADQSGQVQAWAVDIALTIPDDDVEWLKKRSKLRKREQVLEDEWKVGRKVQEYIKDEVLESPSSALVWWLARNVDKVQEAVPLIKPLAQLVAAANSTDAHEQFRHVISEPHGDLGRDLLPTVWVDPAIKFIDEYFPNPDDPQRAHLADDLVRVLASHDIGPDSIACLRDTFELDPFEEEPLLVNQSAPSGPALLAAKLDESNQQ